MSARTTSGISAGLALLPVRLFLGVTFVYAGYQKLSDPGFLTPGSATYIGTQLHAFATGTPGGFLLRWFALPLPARRRCRRRPGRDRDRPAHHRRPPDPRRGGGRARR